MEDIFGKNTIKSSVEEIQRIVSSQGALVVLFPTYLPEHGIGLEYSVVGKERCQTRIANLLKANGLEVKKILPRYYAFFAKELPEEEKGEILDGAWHVACWMDLVDD